MLLYTVIKVQCESRKISTSVYNVCLYHIQIYHIHTILAITITCNIFSSINTFVNINYHIHILFESWDSMCLPVREVRRGVLVLHESLNQSFSLEISFLIILPGNVQSHIQPLNSVLFSSSYSFIYSIYKNNAAEWDQLKSSLRLSKSLNWKIL